MTIDVSVAEVISTSADGPGFGDATYGAGPYSEGAGDIADSVFVQLITNPSVSEIVSIADSPTALYVANASVAEMSVAADEVSVTVDDLVILTGVQAQTEIGEFEPSFNKIIFLAGQQVEAQASPQSLYGLGGYGLGPYSSAVSGLLPEESINLVGQSATSQIGQFTVTKQAGPRTFFIAGVQQKPIPPGIVMLPTSEDLSVTYGGSDLYGLRAYGVDPYGTAPAYVIGSSQFYTIGQVYWNGSLRTEGVDWILVSPFTHIIQILDPGGIGTSPYGDGSYGQGLYGSGSGDTTVTVVYYRWNIGVRAGFQVTSYPVAFAFTGTSIIAEQPPPQDRYFTVKFTSTRPGVNPQTLFSVFPLMVDDMLSDHTLYDGAKGFQTYRPECYQVLDTTLMQIFEWTGSAWMAVKDVTVGTSFYVKTLRAVYENQDGMAVLKYTAGDGRNANYPQAITYPAFGEGIGKNLFVDGFSPDAPTQYPAAYQVCSTPGTYESVCQDQSFDYDFDFNFS